jgi:hypothetical protein
MTAPPARPARITQRIVLGGDFGAGGGIGKITAIARLGKLHRIKRQKFGMALIVIAGSKLGFPTDVAGEGNIALGLADLAGIIIGAARAAGGGQWLAFPCAAPRATAPGIIGGRRLNGLGIGEIDGFGIETRPVGIGGNCCADTGERSRRPGALARLPGAS